MMVDNQTANAPELRLLITDKCNYNCIFCHGEGSTINVQNEQSCLSAQDYGTLFRVYKQIYGAKEVTITGGEPCMRRDLLEIAKLLKLEGAEITLVTNGSKLAKFIKSGLTNYVRRFNVSLHTLDPVKYRKLGAKNLSATLSNIRLIREVSDAQIHLNVVVNEGINDTIEEINTLVIFAKEVKATIKLLEILSVKHAHDPTKIVQKYDSFAKMATILAENHFNLISHANRGINFISPSGVEVRIDRSTCGMVRELSKKARESACRSELVLSVTAQGCLKSCFMRQTGIDALLAIKSDDEQKLKISIVKAVLNIGKNCPQLSTDIEDLLL